MISKCPKKYCFSIKKYRELSISDVHEILHSSHQLLISVCRTENEMIFLAERDSSSSTSVFGYLIVLVVTTWGDKIRLDHTRHTTEDTIASSEILLSHNRHSDRLATTADINDKYNPRLAGTVRVWVSDMHHHISIPCQPEHVHRIKSL